MSGQEKPRFHRIAWVLLAVFATGMARPALADPYQDPPPASILPPPSLMPPLGPIPPRAPVAPPPPPSVVYVPVAMQPAPAPVIMTPPPAEPRESPTWPAWLTAAAVVTAGVFAALYLVGREKDLAMPNTTYGDKQY